MHLSITNCLFEKSDVSMKNMKNPSIKPVKSMKSVRSDAPGRPMCTSNTS